MVRSLTAAVDTEVQQPDIRVALLAFFDFSSGAVRFWSGVGSLVWNGDTYTGAGNLGSVSLVEETTELRATGLTFALAGIPSALLATALGEHYQGRACTMWLALFDDNWTVIADPAQVFSGRMDQMEITETGETAVIRLSAENRLIDLERPNEVRYYTPEDQKRSFPGDKGLDYVPSLQEKVIVWGRHQLAPSKAKPTGGDKPGTGGGGVVPPGGGGGGGGGGRDQPSRDNGGPFGPGGVNI